MDNNDWTDVSASHAIKALGYAKEGKNYGIEIWPVYISGRLLVIVLLVG